MKTKKSKIVALFMFLAALALALKRILSIPFYIIGMFASVYKGDSYEYHQAIAEVYDVTGNVIGKYVWILALKDKKKGYKPGDRRDTISYFLARNKYLNLTNPYDWENSTDNRNWFGKFLTFLTFERDHLKKSLLNNKRYYENRK